MKEKDSIEILLKELHQLRLNIWNSEVSDISTVEDSCENISNTIRLLNERMTSL